MKETQAELHKRPRFIVFVLALIFCVVLMMGVILFINYADQPALNGPLDLTGGAMSLADGTTVSPAPDGTLPVPAGETLYIRCPLPGVYRGKVTLRLIAEGVDAALLVDGRLVTSPSGRFQTGFGFPDQDLDAPAGGSLEGLWTIRYQEGSQLTVAVQFLTASPSLEALPSITLFSAFIDYQTDPLSTDIWSALFAGLFLAGGCTLLFAFLLTLWMGFPDRSILLLAVTTLALCAQRMALCSNTVAVPAMPELMLVAKNCTVLPLMWLLWLKLSRGPLKTGMFPLVLVSTGAMGALLLLQVFSDLSLIPAIEWMRAFWLPVSFLALLAAGAASAFRRNQWYRSFYPLMGCVLAAAAVLTALFWLLTGRGRAVLAPSISGMNPRRSLFPLYSRLSVLVVFTCFILTVVQFIQLLVERDRELQTSELHNRLASEHADALYRTLLETRSVRHEIRSRTETLRTLCREGDLQRIRAYVEQFCEQSQIASSLYTANTLVNALVAPRFQAAQDEGIQVTAAIQIPETLPIADLDLSTVLSNLLDNAVVAASRVPADQPRELAFRMELERGRLHIFCRNSYTGKIRLKPDGLPASQSGEWHGYGIRLVRQTVQKYDGFLDVQYDDHLFTVYAVMMAPPGPEKT